MNAEYEAKDIEAFETIAFDNHIAPDLLVAFADNEGIDDPEEALDAFRESYQGTWSRIREWAEDILEQTGELSSIPESLRFYFNYDAYARDCEMGGDIYTIDTPQGVAVFRNF